jgi:hypothetical protein
VTLFPRIVVVPCRPSVVMGEPDVESRDVFEDDVQSSRRTSHYYFHPLNKKLTSPVSRRHALNAARASLFQKSIQQFGPSRGPGNRLGGITASLCPFFDNVDIVQFF